MKVSSQRGFSMLEVLVSLFIILIGLLGIAALNLRAGQVEFESYQRAQALELLDTMTQRLAANQEAVDCYTGFTVTGVASGARYLGVGADVSGNACTVTTSSLTGNTVQSFERDQAQSDLQTWDGELKGAAVQEGSNAAGSMLGARGCILYDASQGAVLLMVAWQGKTRTVAPPASLNCAAGLYGSENNRRVLARWLSIADMNPPTY